MQSKSINQLANVIDEALELLGDDEPTILTYLDSDFKFPSLLEQCVSLCDEAAERRSAPIRTIHHLPGSGGSLFSNCLASMPNILFLNEVNPLGSPCNQGENRPIAPSDLISLLKQGDPQTPDKTIIQMFAENLATIRKQQSAIGRTIILRDHPWHNLLPETDLSASNSLREMVESEFPIRSVITIRDPVDTYLSLNSQGWHNGQTSPDFDDFCKTYLGFLDIHHGMAIIKYEDMISEPEQTMQKLCKILELDYSDMFIDLLDFENFATRSDRPGEKISKLPRRAMSQDFFDAVRQSQQYKQLADRLGYEKPDKVTHLEIISKSEFESQAALPKSTIKPVVHAPAPINTTGTDNSAVPASNTDINEHIATTVKAELSYNNPNPYVHNRIMNRQLNAEIRKFAAESMGLDNLKTTYIDYLAAKAVQIEVNCSGRLATTVEDAVIRQLVAETITSDHLHILEIGALYGVNLAILYNHAATRFEDVKLICLDPFDGFYGAAVDLVLNASVNDLTFKRNMKLGNVPETDFRIIKKYSTDKSAIKDAARQSFNLLVIDGDHSYAGVKFDYDNYLPLLEPGGYVIIDDYNADEWPDVKKFIDDEVIGSDNIEFIGAFSRTAIIRKNKKNSE